MGLLSSTPFHLPVKPPMLRMRLLLFPRSLVLLLHQSLSLSPLLFLGNQVNHRLCLLEVLASNNLLLTLSLHSQVTLPHHLCLVVPSKLYQLLPWKLISLLLFSKFLLPFSLQSHQLLLLSSALFLMLVLNLLHPHQDKAPSQAITSNLTMLQFSKFSKFSKSSKFSKFSKFSRSSRSRLFRSLKKKLQDMFNKLFSL